jgi:hypothetical protein
MTWIKRAVLTTLCCAAASAGPITFTEIIANASGSLDGTGFTSQTVTLVLTGDTSTIGNPIAGVYFDFGTATVSVSGGGTDTFTDSMAVADNQNVNVAGITDTTSSSLVLSVANSSFATYALSTSIGPLSGGTQGNPGTSYPTVGGFFEFTSSLNVDHPASFTATTGSVPEPGTLGLLGAGIGLLLIGRRAAR